MEEIILEEIKKVDGFITVLDDDGMVTVQMSEDSIGKIINAFDNLISIGAEYEKMIEVTEFGKTFQLSFSLNTIADGVFNLIATVNSNHYHHFELECCDMVTWEKIKEIYNS